jgi:inorganic phosphate transporter, PiT family
MQASATSTETILLTLLALAFAWNLGAHYTGAVMGMPFSARVVALWPALVLVGVFAWLGATFGSERVELTVGRHLVADRSVSISQAIVIVAVAGALTAFYNYRRIPTSTIQILVFTVIGVGLATRTPIFWTTLGKLVLVWVFAPLIALGLGFAFTRLLDLVVRPLPGPHGGAEAAKRARKRRRLLSLAGLLPALLLGAGMGASFVMGANDVANATGPLVLAHAFGPRIAGFIGGAAIAVGAVTWGARILRTVAFDIVSLDLSMAAAAQAVQALVVVVAVTQGYFTSMNQALVGAMVGAGLARGRETVKRGEVQAILRGWLIGPVSGLILGYAGGWIVRGLHL